MFFASSFRPVATATLQLCASRCTLLNSLWLFYFLYDDSGSLRFYDYIFGIHFLDITGCGYIGPVCLRCTFSLPTPLLTDLRFKEHVFSILIPVSSLARRGIHFRHIYALQLQEHHDILYGDTGL